VSCEFGDFDDRKQGCLLTVDKGVLRKTNFLYPVGLVPSVLQFSETEYAYYTDSGASAFKCAACVETLRSQRNDDAPVKPRFSLTSDLSKKIVSPQWALVLLPVFVSHKYWSLSAQLETILRTSQ
jgi:hypothetical protein